MDIRATIEIINMVFLVIYTAMLVFLIIPPYEAQMAALRKEIKDGFGRLEGAIEKLVQRAAPGFVKSGNYGEPPRGELQTKFMILRLVR